MAYYTPTVQDDILYYDTIVKYSVPLHCLRGFLLMVGLHQGFPPTLIILLVFCQMILYYLLLTSCLLHVYMLCSVVTHISLVEIVSNIPSRGIAGPNIGTSYDLVTDTLGVVMKHMLLHNNNNKTLKITSIYSCSTIIVRTV